MIERVRLKLDEPEPVKVRSGPTLKRQAFTTSRLLDFCNEKELTQQLGHGPEEWPLVVVKELIDNALDACEEAGIAPVVSVKVDAEGIAVQDNGPGLPASTLKGVMDFSVRVSSREAYVSPTRGAQGNAFKGILAIPYVVNGRVGHVQIEALGKHSKIRMEVDPIAQEPKLHLDTETTPTRRGTLVRVELPGLVKPKPKPEPEPKQKKVAPWFTVSASSNDDEDQALKERFLQIADDFTWLNPHLDLTVDWSGEVRHVAPTNPSWTKWGPSDPTCPHWYTPARFERLIAANLSNQRNITVREFISEFRGLSGSAKQKQVLDATGLAREHLTGLVKGNDLDHDLIGKLLTEMKKHTKPVKPKQLGIIGHAHFFERFSAMGGEMESFKYVLKADNNTETPGVVECVFCWFGEDDERQRRLVTGVNWSTAINNPFRSLGQIGVSLDTMLAHQRATADEPVMLVVHVACPRVQYIDRGKSSLVIK